MGLVACDEGGAGVAVGPEGGRVEGTGGAGVDVPAGALSSEVTIEVGDAEPSAASPGGSAAAGPAIAFTPHGTTFAMPVTLTIPVTADPTEVTVFRLDDERDTTWEAVPGGEPATDAVLVETDRFSIYQAFRSTAPVMDAGADSDAGAGDHDAGPVTMDAGATPDGGGGGITIAGAAYEEADSFTVADPSGTWLWLASGDLDGDGDADLAGVYDVDSPALFANAGGGTFAAAVPMAELDIQHRTGVTGDFDGDGNLDVAVMTFSGVAMVWGGDTYMETRDLLTPISAFGVLGSGDLDGDGRDDVTSGADGNALVYFGSTDRTLTATTTAVGADAYGSSPVDLDDDGDLDLVYFQSDGSDRYVHVLQNDGAGALTAGATFMVGSDIVGAAAGDFDGDGVDDIALAGEHGTAWVLFGTTGTLAAPAAIDAGSSTLPVGNSLCAADLDGDGDLDLINQGGVAVNAGDGTFTTEATPTLGGTWPAAVATDDFDGDGLTDVALQVLESSGSSVHVLLQQP